MENSAETVPQPSQKSALSTIIFFCPFPMSFKCKTASTCRLMTSLRRIPAFDCSKPSTSMWVWHRGGQYLAWPAVRSHEISTCVFTVCLTDRYGAFKSNISCRLRSPVQISHFTPLGVGPLPKRARPARCWTRTWISSAARYKYVKL